MALSKQFTIIPQVFHDYGGMVILPIPDEVVEAFKAAKIKRFICQINGEYEMPCALHSHKGGARFIMLSKRIRSEYDIDPTAPAQIVLREDDSEFGHPVPEEWQAILDFDEEAAAIFSELTPGKQRSVLHMVGAAKREETRINRALKIAENLKLGIRNPQQFLKNH